MDLRSDTNLVSGFHSIPPCTKAGYPELERRKNIPTTHLEVCLDELWMSVVGADELLHEGLVRGLGEPALLVTEGHDAHGLRK